MTLLPSEEELRMKKRIARFVRMYEIGYNFPVISSPIRWSIDVRLELSIKNLVEEGKTK